MVTPTIQNSLPETENFLFSRNELNFVKRGDEASQNPEESSSGVTNCCQCQHIIQSLLSF